MLAISSDEYSLRDNPPGDHYNRSAVTSTAPIIEPNNRLSVALPDSNADKDSTESPDLKHQASVTQQNGRNVSKSPVYPGYRFS